MDYSTGVTAAAAQAMAYRSDRRGHCMVEADVTGHATRAVFLTETCSRVMRGFCATCAALPVGKQAKQPG